MQSASDNRLSRKLCSLLRHRAEENNLAVAPDGFVLVSSILALPQFRAVSPADIARVVASDAKRRFALVDGRIRANQGHTMRSVREEALLARLTVADAPAHPVCVHGTSAGAWRAIRVDGIRRMTRNNVHFGRGVPGEDGVVSGFRASAQVLIYVDIARALQEGVEFFLSENGVLLTPGVPYRGNEGVVPPHLFEKVIDRRSGRSLL